MDSLNTFIRDHEKKNGHKYFDGNTGIRFGLGKQGIEFWNLILELNGNGFELDICEDVGRDKRIIMDVDLFNKPVEGDESTIFLKELSKEIFKFIKENTTYGDEKALCYILGRCDKRKIMFPEIRLREIDMVKLKSSSKKILNNLRDHDFLENFNIVNSKNFKFDSDNSFNIMKYKIDHALEVTQDEVKETDVVVEIEKFEYLLEKEGPEEKYKPVLLSAHYDPKIPVDFIQDEVNQNFDFELYEDGQISTFLENVEKIKYFIELLDIPTRSNYEDWHDVGLSLASLEKEKNAFNIEDIDVDFKKMWIHFTQKCISLNQNLNFSVELCEELWKDMVINTTISYKTIEYFAVIDNCNQHGEFMYDTRREKLNEAGLTKTSGAIARAFASCFPFQFVSDGVDLWEFSVKEHRLKNRGSKTIHPPYLKQFRRKINTYIEELERGDDQSEEIDEIVKGLRDVNKMVDRAGTLATQIISFLTDEYRCEDFICKRDGNPHFLGCENGVFDIRSGRVAFRRGKPEDFITLSTKQKFEENISEDEMEEFDEYLRKMFPHREVCHYIKKVIGSTLEAGNAHKIILQLFGYGNNGKSVICNILTSAFGEYARRTKVSLITEGRNKSDSPDPTLVSLIGTRWVFIQEPGHNETANVGKMKEYSGNDKIQVRDLFQKGREIKDVLFGFKMAIFTNELLTIDDPQKAIWNRLVVVKCISEFTSDAPDDEKEQEIENRYKADKNFDHRKFANAVLHCATKYYPIYKREGLDLPDNMKRDLEEYKNESDIYVNYVNDRLEPKRGSRLVKNEAYADFTNWFKNNGFNGNQKSSTYFAKQITIAINKELTNKTHWVGWKLKEDRLFE